MIKNILKKINRFNNLFFTIKFRLLGANIGSNVIFYGKPSYIGVLKFLTIGENSTINHGVFFNCSDQIQIGDNCRISAYTQFHTGALNLDPAIKRLHFTKPINLSDNVWIAAGVIINPGINIGEGSVIAPGSVVTKDVPKNKLYGGVPAKLIKPLDK